MNLSSRQADGLASIIKKSQKKVPHVAIDIDLKKTKN